MTTKTKTPDQIRAEAEELSRKAAEAQARVDELTMREWEAEQEAQAERDRHTLDAFDRTALDRDVEDARKAFEAALADHPLVQTLAAWEAAGYRRNWAYADVNGARSRLGMEGIGGAPTTYLPSIVDAITTTATRLAQSQIDSERSGA